jgi:hypothetical protein
MSRSFAALLPLAFATALCAQDAAVPPLEGTVIRRLGNTHAKPGHTEMFLNQFRKNALPAANEWDDT